MAICEETNRIAGFINVISDGVLSAYIPLLEVVSPYKNKGIGTKLVELALKECNQIYMIDISCDEDLINFYERFNMKKFMSMCIRNYKNQSGL